MPERLKRVTLKDQLAVAYTDLRPFLMGEYIPQAYAEGIQQHTALDDEYSNDDDLIPIVYLGFWGSLYWVHQQYLHKDHP